MMTKENYHVFLKGDFLVGFFEAARRMGGGAHYQNSEWEWTQDVYEIIIPCEDVDLLFKEPEIRRTGKDITSTYGLGGVIGLIKPDIRKKDTIEAYGAEFYYPTLSSYLAYASPYSEKSILQEQLVKEGKGVARLKLWGYKFEEGLEYAINSTFGTFERGVLGGAKCFRGLIDKGLFVFVPPATYRVAWEFKNARRK